MRNTRILVIEDDDAIRQGIRDALTFEGYTVVDEGHGKRGMELAVRVDCELILLDLVLPGVGGLEILREVRVTRPSLPVIVLTARGDEDDRIQGLKLGADDYVVKPFSVRELLARIEAVLRRSPERPEDLQRVPFAGGVIDLARREAILEEGDRVALSEREVELLRYLALNANRAISRDELLSRVWRMDPRGVDTRTIDMHIARLREKLRDDPGHPRVLRTVRGKGYSFSGRSSGQ
jgi:DNA-binding response OmpR family regulator